MKKTFVLAEKKSVGIDIATAIEPDGKMCEFHIEGRDHLIGWARGHIIRLCEPQDYDPRWKEWNLATLPILPDSFRFQISPQEKRRFDSLRSLIHREDVGRVVVATDAGREGELIGRLILLQAGNAKPVFRFWTSEALTFEAVCRTMANLRPAEEFDPLYRAALGRLYADWLIGINGTRALSVRANLPGTTYPLGRVKGPVIRMIAQRQNEIESFQPRSFWTVHAHFSHGKNLEFKGTWVSSVGGGSKMPFLPESIEEEQDYADKGISLENEEESSRIWDKFEANKIVNRTFPEGMRIEKRKTGLRIYPKVSLDNNPTPPFAGGIIHAIDTVSKIVQPPRLLNSSTLLQEAFKELGFPLEKTERLAQSLYQTRKVISYPRSESCVLPKNYFERINIILDALEQDGFVFGKNILEIAVDNKRIFDDGGLVEGHYAIVPTGVSPENLSPDETKLFELIVRRFIAAFYPPFVYESTQILAEVSGEIFRTRRTSVTQPGWKEFLNHKIRNDGGLFPLKLLKVGNPIRIDSLILSEGHTNPPSPYNDATLIYDMTHVAKFVDDENLKKVLRQCSGLGTSATRGKIVKAIVDAGYVVRMGKGRGMLLANKGRILDRALMGQDIMDPGVTAVWESRLEKIAREEGGTMENFLNEVKTSVVELVDEVRTIPQDLLDDGENIGHCPECGDHVRERLKGYFCRNHPNCSFSFWKDRLKSLGKKNISREEMRQLLSGGVILLTKLRGKNKKAFNATGCLVKTDHGWQIKFLRKGENPPAFPKTRIPLPETPETAPPSSGEQQNAVAPQDETIPRLVKMEKPCACLNSDEASVPDRPEIRDPEVLSRTMKKLFDSLCNKNQKAIQTSDHDLSPLKKKIAEFLQMDLSPENFVDRIKDAPEIFDGLKLPGEFMMVDKVLAKEHSAMCNEWLISHKLIPRIKAFQRVRFFENGEWWEGPILDIQLYDGNFIVYVAGTDRDNFVIPWERAFCTSCNRTGLTYEPDNQ